MVIPMDIFLQFCAMKLCWIYISGGHVDKGGKNSEEEILGEEI